MKELTIKVLSRQNVEKFVTDLPHIIISVRDPNTDRAKLPDNPNRIAELYLDFEDADPQYIPNGLPLKMFHSDDAKSILTIVKLTESYINLIVVNCEAGISRSSAIAASLSLIFGMGDAIYFNPRGPYMPNRFVYRTIVDEALNQGWNPNAPKN